MTRSSDDLRRRKRNGWNGEVWRRFTFTTSDFLSEESNQRGNDEMFA